jgi:hypothetical protein
VFSWSFAYKVFVMADWLIHYEYIAENLCVKKDDKQNTCKGSCHLSAKLKTVESEPDETEGIPVPARLNIEVLQPFIEVSLFSLVAPDNVLGIAYLLRPQLLHPFQFYSDIFHPPQA